MAALWQPFERAVTQFLTKTTDKQISFTEFLAGAYTVATTPITVKYTTGPITQPVINGALKQKILKDAIDKMLTANSKKNEPLKPIDFLPAAIAFCKYWTPGIGVIISPVPAAPPCFAPIVAGYFISQDEFNQAAEFAGIKNLSSDTEDIFSKVLKEAIVSDPVVVFPSPIVLFPGNPLLLANDLHFAMTKSFSPQATAKNLVTAFRNHLSTIIGIYIGFKDPATPPQPLPFTIIVFNGIS